MRHSIYAVLPMQSARNALRQSCTAACCSANASDAIRTKRAEAKHLIGPARIVQDIDAIRTKRAEAKYYGGANVR